MFQVQNKNNVDNTLMFQILLSGAVQSQRHSSFSAFLSHWVERGVSCMVFSFQLLARLNHNGNLKERSFPVSADFLLRTEKTQALNRKSLTSLLVNVFSIVFDLLLVQFSTQVFNYLTILTNKLSPSDLRCCMLHEGVVELLFRITKKRCSREFGHSRSNSRFDRYFLV